MRSVFGLSLLWIATISAAPQSADRFTGVNAPNLQTGYCPQTHELEVEPSQKYFLEGTIGKRHVRMYLDRGGAGVVGLFFEVDDDWQTTLLGGTWNNGAIEMSDAADEHPATGYLKASFAADRLSGTWAVSTSNERETVELATISEPRCDGRGAWKRFNDPGWPVAFSYPAAWHLDETDDGSITLTCPNPSEIAYDQHISIHHGTGAPDGPTKLVQCGSSWIYGFQCRCGEQDSDRCPTAKVSHLKSATILDVSEQEHRNYCLKGGYVNAGEGEDRVVLFGDQWLEINAPVDTSEIMKRLIGSVTLRKRKLPEK